VSPPRLLAGTRDGSATLAAHEAVHGPERSPADLIDAVARAGLRGRGGAAFPTAVKLRSVAARRGPRCVLVNGAESEPMSGKDRLLMHLAPHLVLDGALAAARAIDARRVLVAVREDAVDAEAAMLRAVAERGLERTVDVRRVPVAHLAGEESALIRFLDGGPLRPASDPRRPFERGLGRRPTLVQNPETLAHLALIARHGPDWFREVGTEAQPGTTLVTIDGAVRHTGVVEIACGTPLTQLMQIAGGPLRPLRAVLVGGYHGLWVDAAAIPSVTLDDASLAAHGGGLGSGIVVALPKSACAVTEVTRTMRWLADESAGQCGPCANGLPAIATLLEELAAGRAGPGVHERLARWSDQLAGRGACHLPDGATRFLAAGLRVFAAEFADHQRHGPCRACHRRPTTLHTPSLAAAVAA
jgi:NADH:ubiquinone oxidoreductase subunit F (NADH-binding)